MSIYQRPLFMQAGGPVMQQPVIEPQGMPMDPGMGGMPPELAQQAAMIEQEAAGRVQELGGQYIDNTMMALDAAETTEDVINAIRGNVQPLEARYMELAQLVGEEDAGATPQSVLALVQPTILMTEQGAMDSGVGGLMQNLVGEVEMAFPDGTPTDMGQGVGGLMMAGAPDQGMAMAPEMGVGQPPVANFNQGGAVQRFQAGGEASRLESLYSEMLPVYQSILGDGEDQRRMTQAQILFDISDRAGAFAAGIDPRTGQRVQGSPAAQLAAAASGLGGQIGERLGAQEQQDRALKLSALQAAQGEFSAERADQRAAARAAAAGQRDRALGNLFDIVDAEGNVVQQAIPIATQEEYAALMERVPGGRIRPSTAASSPTFNAQTLYGPGGEIITANVGTPEGVAQAEGLIGQGFTDQRPEGFKAETLFSPEGDPVTINTGNTAGARRAEGLLEQGFTTEAPAVGPSKGPVNVQMPDGSVQTVREDDPRLDSLIAEGGTVVSRTAAQVESPLVQPNLMERYGRGETTPQEDATIQDEIARRTAQRYNPATGEFEQPEVTPLVLQSERNRAERGLPTVIATPDRTRAETAAEERELNLSELGGHAFGTGSFLRELVNRSFALVDAEAPFRETEQATAAITALNQDALIAFRDLTQGRTAQEAVNQFQNVLPEPGRIASSPSRAASEIDAVLDFFNAQIQNANQALATGVVSASEQQRLQSAIIRAEQMAGAYQAVKDGITRGPRVQGRPDPSQFRR